jgi:cellulose synthase (UDP-forming)
VRTELGCPADVLDHQQLLWTDGFIGQPGHVVRTFDVTFSESSEFGEQQIFRGHSQNTPVEAARPDLFLKDVLEGRTKVLYWAGVGIWFFLLLYFWQWWLAAEDHLIGYAPYTVVTLVLVWVTLLPAYFMYIFGRSKLPVPARIEGRIAMVVTKAPSEPFGVVQKTLEAMLGQVGCRFDTWLADEDPTSEAMAWCSAHGVKISSRKNVAEYHRPEWPRRTRCKEGNLAYFYDRYGYANYDFVAQLDADHVPTATYLLEILAPFANPKVGYVSAPSICDANASESWSARGRLHTEASMHGSLQAGYNGDFAPLCIGSHYAVRTSALLEIGGLGPELAEDHSTTLMMNASGWQGVHAINAIAHGDGPKTFVDLATQEFQWSRSVVSILLRYSPQFVPKLSGLKRFQFIFSELWYPLFSLFMLVAYFLPIYALATGSVLVNVSYPDFFMHFTPVSVWLVVLAFFWRSTGTFRPVDAKILNLDSAIFIFARWPWALLGSLAAFRDRFSSRFVDFRITPKGATSVTMLPFRVIAPYAALSLVSGFAARMAAAPEQVWGFYIFAAVNSVVYALVLVWIVGKHIMECGNPWSILPKAKFAVATAVVLLALPTVAAYDNGMRGLHSLTHGLQAIEITTIVYPAAGAGTGRSGMKIVRLNPRLFGVVRSDQATSDLIGSNT